ncbi:hypothetical protein [Alcaligenes faecalis]|uniref:hypothetical protein n=1 Tax=Alcaligenes faecalis TaxID=511 RepID=UPI00214FE561|nr:hypothetical protein [Alcaligenes faecalis]MCR4142924.1 hypothetical protein [Alcaligenes faecalis]
MDLLHQLIYLQEIQAQCRMALQAGNALNQAFARTEPIQTVEDGAMKTAEIFRNVHSMLTHVANISQFLWPTGRLTCERQEPQERQERQDLSAQRERRANALRTLLDLPAKDHPLRHRDVRNHLEHFDERLDRWARKGEMPPDIWQDSIGAWEVPTEQFEVDQKNVMRHFEPQTGTFRFQGEPWNIPDMIEAVKALRQKVDAVEIKIRNTLYPIPGSVQSDRVRILD